MWPAETFTSAQVEQFADNVEEARLRWFEHVQRRVIDILNIKSVEDGAARQ